MECLRNELPVFDEYFHSTSIDNEESGRTSDKLELWHLISAFVDVAWKEGSIREANVRWIFDKLAWHFKSILGERESHGL